MAAKKTSGKASVKIASNIVKAPKAPEKTINDLKGKTDKSYPWALFADCILMLVFIFANGWRFRLDIQLYFVIAAAVIFIIQMFRKENRKRLFSRISLIFVVLLAQCLLYFAGLFYAYYPKFALQEFLMNMGALFVFATAYVSFSKTEFNFKRLVLLLSAVLTIATLVSIEIATSGLLRPLFITIAGLLNAQVADGYGAFETNTRITTVLGSPNVFAPMTVLAMFGSLWSCGRAGERLKEGFVHVVFAVACGIGFILCFSLGTILCYAAAFIIYMIVTPKGEKVVQFIRHLFCFAFSLVGAGVVFVFRSASVLPLLFAVITSLLAALVYTRAKPVRLPVIISKHKRFFITGGIALCVGFLICAVSLHGPYTMRQGETFKRAVALKPGMYTLQMATDESNMTSSLIVDVSSQSYTEATLKIKTQLVTATVLPGQSVNFSVPDASAAVFVTFTATNDIMLKDAVIDNGTAPVRLPLRYAILPEFIVNRLQGLWVNDNAIQRFIFFRDGIRLGMRSPIMGLGGGAFEGGVFSVADYYYETKHVHNEFIQRFVDGGILGLLLFTALPVILFRALYIAKKSEKFKPVFALLFVCMAMIFLHSLIEVDFLMVSYRTMASILFAAVAALSGDTLVTEKKVRATIQTLFILLTATTVLLSLGRYIANKRLDQNLTLESLQDAMWMDPLNKTDYELFYLMNTSALSDPYIINYQNKYLNSLDKQIVGNDTVAQFYLTRIEPDGEKGTKAAELFIRENRLRPEVWNKFLYLYFSVLSNTNTDDETRNAVIASSHRLIDYLNELNSTLPIEIIPDQSLLSVLENMLSD